MSNGRTLSLSGWCVSCSRRCKSTIPSALSIPILVVSRDADNSLAVNRAAVALYLFVFYSAQFTRLKKAKSGCLLWFLLSLWFIFIFTLVWHPLACVCHRCAAPCSSLTWGWLIRSCAAAVHLSPRSCVNCKNRCCEATTGASSGETYNFNLCRRLVWKFARNLGSSAPCSPLRG